MKFLPKIKPSLSKRTVGRFLLLQLRDLLIVSAIGMVVSTFFGGFAIWKSFPLFKRVFLYVSVLGYSMWKFNEVLTWLVEVYFPYSKNPKTTLILDLIANLVASVLVIFVVNYYLYPLLYGMSITQDFQRFMVIALIQLFISFGFSATTYINKFFVEWRKATIAAEELKHQALVQQYEVLKGYVNPHFLFNNLSVLSSLVEEDSQKSIEFIKQLSNNYRYVIEQKENELVPLNVELDFARSYIELYKIRFGDNLKVHIELTDVSGYTIPLSLQILLENCFKHNIISEEKPLNVSVNREGSYLIVSNNLQKRKAIPGSGQIGLETLMKRYELMTSTPVVVIESEGFFTVKTPIISDKKTIDLL